MQTSQNDIITLLGRHNIRPSAQRIAVMKALVESKSHPTAEYIFDMLSPQMPTLSLTTVYNTLKLLADKGVVSVLGMDRRYAHFDYVGKPHAHMWCRKCGKVVDVQLSVPVLSASEAAGFSLDEVDVCYKGLCPECKRNII